MWFVSQGYFPKQTANALWGNIKWGSLLNIYYLVDLGKRRKKLDCAKSWLDLRGAWVSLRIVVNVSETNYKATSDLPFKVN